MADERGVIRTWRYMRDHAVDGVFYGALREISAATGYSVSQICQHGQMLCRNGSVEALPPPRTNVARPFRIIREPDIPLNVHGPKPAPIVSLDDLRLIATPEYPVARLLVIIEEWLSGTSVGQIAKKIGATKNAVVGKTHRLMAFGLIEPRPSPIGGYSDAPPRERRVPRTTGPTLPPLASVAEKVMPPRSTLPGYNHARRVIAATATAHAIRGPTLPPLAEAAKKPPAPIWRPMPVYIEPAAVPRPIPVVAAPKYGRVIDCCWPIGEPGSREFRMCDEPSEAGRPYCRTHVAAAYVKARPPREDATA